VTASGSRLRVGFIGAGFSARLHAEAYRQVRGVDVALTRVAAARPERAARFAGEFGVGAVAVSAEEVLAAADVDAVDLCVPTSLHAPLAIKAARAGKHVIVEKPLTGCFAPSATPRAEMLRRAPASGDEIIVA
jgi:predicted dehydrogenase